MANYNIDAIYNGSTSLPGTERIRIDGAGNVGINQSSPAYKLDVNGTARIANDMLATGNITIGKAAAYLILDGTNSDAEIYWRANSSNRWAAGMNVGDATENFNIYNYTTATTNLTILKANGNVGIGSTAPAYKLDVNGSIGVVGLRFVDQSTSYFRIFEPAGNIAIYLGNAADPANYYDNSTHFFRNRGGSSTYAVIEGNGNLGIGTTSVTAPLHIYRASNPWIRLNGGGNYSYIRFDDGTSNGYLFKNTSSDTSNGALAGAMYTYTDSGKAFQHIHGGTPLFTILSGGNVGIGTSGPSTLLQLRQTSASHQIFSINRANSATAAIYIGNDSSDNAIIASNNTALRLGKDFTGTFNEYARIDSNGNLGIGTSSPSNKLHVWTGTVQVSGFQSIAGGPLTFLRSDYNGSAAVQINFLNINPSNGYDSDLGIQLMNTGGSMVDVLRIKGSTGNVGIGTTNPGAKLVVIGETQISSNSAYTTHLNYQDSGINFISMANGGYTDFRGSSNNVTTMRVKGDGNVGIGTTTVRSTLHVNGDIIRDTNVPYSWSTSAPFRTFAGAYSYANGGVSGVARYLLLWPQITNVNGQNGRFVNARLVVSRGATHAFNDTTIGDVVASAGYNSSANLYSYTPIIGEKLYFYNIVYNSVTYLAISLPISDYRWELTGHYGIEETAYYSPTFVYANTSGVGTVTQLTDYTNESLSIYNKTNNIGIGTTNPTAKLHIAQNNSGGVPAIRLSEDESTIQGPSANTQIRMGSNLVLNASNVMLFGTNGNEAIRILSNGNVGIGTTSPTQVLHISSTNSGNNGLTISTTSATGNPQVRFLNSAGSERAAITYVSSADGVYFYTAASNSNLLNFIGSNVGIGTTSPAYKLEVIGDARVSGGIVNGGLSAQWTLSGGGTALFNGYIFWSNRIIAIPVERTEFGADGYIDITCPTSGTITYYNSSNVTTTVTCDANGIPTSAWESLYYEVTPGQSAASDPTKFRLVNYQNSTWRPSSNWLLICTRNGDGNFIKWIPGQVIIPNGGAFDSSNSTNNWQIAGTTNYVPKFTAANKIGNSAIYDSSGNIGIGTTSPFGTAANRTVLSVNGTTDVSLNIGSGGSQRAYLYGVSTYAELGTIGSLPLRFAPNNSEKMRINVDGNVGIGTSNPISLLQIAGTTSMFPTYDSITGYSYFLRMGYDTSGSYDYTIKRNGTTGFLEFNGTQGSPYVSYVFAGGDVYSGASGGTVGGFYFNSSSHGIRRATGTNDVYCFTTSGTLYLGAGGSSTTHVRVLSGGDVGIGVSPSYKLDVNGNIHGTGFPTSSDVRFKKNITPLQNSLEKIKKLQGVKYEWNEFVNSRRDGYKLNIPIIGLIAQDVEQVVPEIVDHWKLSDDCQDARSIDYPRLIPLLIEAIKEQQNQIEELRNEIKSLKSN